MALQFHSYLVGILRIQRMEECRRWRKLSRLRLVKKFYLLFNKIIAQINGQLFSLKKKIMDDLDYIIEALQYVRKYGFEAEVVLTALQTMKNNPNQSIQEAFEFGIDEWIR